MQAILSAFAPLATMGKPMTPLQRRRAHCVAEMESAVIDAINDEAQLESDSDYKGDFQYVADATVEVELGRQCEVRGYLIERPESFSGKLDGYAWGASVKHVKWAGRVVTLTLSVSSDE